MELSDITQLKLQGLTLDWSLRNVLVGEYDDDPLGLVRKATVRSGVQALRDTYPVVDEAQDSVSWSIKTGGCTACGQTTWHGGVLC